jgi:GTPase
MTVRSRDPVALSEALLAGDRGALPRLLSVVEAGGAPAREVGRRIHRRAGAAYTVGLTGPPGAGKSTLTDRLITLRRSSGEEVAVLAVDPSSPYSGGALLGDRVRMMDHALDPGVFVRSMATRGHLGGLALAVPEVVRALDVAGYPTILVETVGVGQSEVEIAGAADTTLVVLPPGSGDSVQANKAGLFEVADVFVINKADDPRASQLHRDLEMMMDLSTWSDGWRPPVVRTTAIDGGGVVDVWDAVASHRAHLEQDGRLERRRGRRALAELQRVLVASIEASVEQRLGESSSADLLAEVASGEVDPWTAAERILGNA